MAETIVSGKNGRNVAQLVQAAENKGTVILKNYASAHSDDIRDPYAFTTNYVQIWSYCPEGKNKLFKISCIGSCLQIPESTADKADCPILQRRIIGRAYTREVI